MTLTNININTIPTNRTILIDNDNNQATPETATKVAVLRYIPASVPTVVPAEIYEQAHIKLLSPTPDTTIVTGVDYLVKGISKALKVDIKINIEGGGFSTLESDVTVASGLFSKIIQFSGSGSAVLRVEDSNDNTKYVDVNLTLSGTSTDIFSFDASTGAITGYDKAYGENIVIPDQIDGVDVLHVADDVFKYDPYYTPTKSWQVSTVSFPSTLLTIGTRSFLGHKLSVLSLPVNLTTIGDYAFAGKSPWVGGYSLSSSLDNITLPNSVTTLGTGSFRYLRYWTSLSISSGVTEIPDYCFGNSVFFRSVEFPELVTIPDGVTTIGFGSFGGSGFTKVNLGTGITKIHAYAFSYRGNAGMREITIPSGVDVSSVECLGETTAEFRPVYNTGGAGTYIASGISDWSKT